MKKVGVLSLQGSTIEHAKMIESCGCEAVYVKSCEDMNRIDGLILPGGESTVLGKLLIEQGLMHPLREKISNGLPVYGTCAGMILLAKEIENDCVKHLALMDILVRRNAYGSQQHSFVATQLLRGMTLKEVPLVFVRAPFIVKANHAVKTWDYEGKTIAARQKNMFVTSFHPELTDYKDVHEYFISML